MKKKACLIFFSVTLSSIFSQDIIVDNSKEYTVTNHYAKFDRYTKHGGYNNYDYVNKDLISLPNDFPTLGSTFTLEAMTFTADSSQGLHQKIIGNKKWKGNYNETSPNITFLNKNEIFYGFYSDGKYRMKLARNVRKSNTWHHVAFTFDGNKARLYIDGVRVDSTSNWSGRVPDAIPIEFIGARFRGKLDEVRIWSVARTEEEIKVNMETLSDANATGLIAYYNMDTNENFKIIDRSSNEHHATIDHAEILQDYSSDSCLEPDGSSGCPYPNLLSALEAAQGGQSILIKEGRYSDLAFADYINHSPYTEGPKLHILGENDKTMIDGTVEIKANWEPFNLNGHSVYRAELDMGAISKKAKTFIDTIYGVFVDDRYMIPAMPVNFKNPTDPTTGNKDNPEPNTVWKNSGGGRPYPMIRSGADKSLNYSYEVGQIANLDTLEEWAFEKQSNTLYIYPGQKIPNESNVRVRVRTHTLNLHHSDNLIFDNLHFYASAFFSRHGSYITIKNSRFSHSWEADLRHREMVKSGIDMRKRGNMMVDGNHNAVRNTIFRYVVDAYIFHFKGIKYPIYENILAEYNGWFGNAYWNLKVNDNCKNCNQDITKDENYFSDTWRYITMRQNKSGNIGPGSRSLVEYAWIENHYQNTDGSGIGRATGLAVRSTTRYSWMLNTNRNGLRFDGECAGQYGLVHHVVSLGTKRGYRLKGDKHNIYHVMAYDNWDTDINLAAHKYCGDYGTSEFEKKVQNMKGNHNTDIHNSIAGRMLNCASQDCGDQALTDNGANVKKTDPKFLLNQSGIWYGRQFPIDNNEGHWSQSFPQLELEDPWLDNRNRHPEQLTTIFGSDPFENDRIQSYDFRPRKGSIFIDAGKVIEGINDGQDENFYHASTYSKQNRKYVGDAPDIGPYEYGDSVYWIPGFRTAYPSIPIPRDGAKNVSLEYGLAWNYPWKENYSGTSATVAITGPGQNMVKTFQYPNNVMFVKLKPGGKYTWRVTVDGVAGDSWTFTARDQVYPLNDRSLDLTIQDSTYLPQQFQKLLVSKDHYAFLKFDIPIEIDNSYKVNMNLTPGKVFSLKDGIVLYKYNFKGWNERFDGSNIGVVDKTDLTPIDTFLNISANEKISIDVAAYIDSIGEHSFALSGLSRDDSVYFFSRDKLVLNGDFDRSVEDHNSGYATQVGVWPSISFSGESVLAIDEEKNILPKQFALHDNYPNPFNPNTTIRFDLPKEIDVSIIIFNLLGQKVKTIDKSQMNAGFHSITWNGTNDHGAQVSAGMYLYQLRTSDFVKTKKMVLLK
ncbi:MAG: LamG-like jellyroll fold domain-containing protein [Candidatus Neomarinimicrobiota bacterium]|nr:LamG-like jellyroll fold domain-containing protein [Candidatus Neomarinimicrobiota bacterium]